MTASLTTGLSGIALPDDGMLIAALPLTGAESAVAEAGRIPLVAGARALVIVAAEHMAALVEDLLLLARLDQARPLAGELANLFGIVQQAVADARAGDPQRVLVVELPDRSPLCAVRSWPVRPPESTQTGEVRPGPGEP